METTRPYRVFINGAEIGGLYAASYSAARKAARAIYRISCDVIG